MFEQFVGTKPVEERHRIDTGALEKYLSFRLARLEQFKGGQSNPTYLLTAADGRRFVLRRRTNLRPSDALSRYVGLDCPPLNCSTVAMRKPRYRSSAALSMRCRSSTGFVPMNCSNMGLQA